MIRLLHLTILFCIPLSLFAQINKRPLTHADYDRWQSARSEKIAANGQWISYQVDVQEGDGTLYVRQSNRSTAANVPQEFRFPRGYQAQFTADSKFLVAKLKAPYGDTRKAKLKKKKPDEMPKDSLLVLNLSTGQVTRFPNAKSFVIGKNGGNWLAFLQERKEAGGTGVTAEARPTPGRRRNDADADTDLTAETDTTAPTPKTAAPRSQSAGARAAAAKKPKGDDLIIVNMADGSKQMIRYVSSVVASDNGKSIFFSRESHVDSLKAGQNPVPGVYLFDTRNQQIATIDTSSKRKIYKGLAIDTTGTNLAWIASADSANAEVKAFTLYYKNMQPLTGAVASGKKAKTTTVAPAVWTIADTTTKALPKGWSINEFTTPRFSKDGKRLYFATAPIPQKSIKDTLTPDDEKVKMDIWSWTDSRLQPMQQKRLREEKERGFLTVCDLTTNLPATATARPGNVVMLASREVPNVRPDYSKNPRYLLGSSDLPYQVISSWDPGHTDLYLIDTQTGDKKKISNDLMASEVQLSPGNKYAYWFDERDSLWRAYSIADSKLIDLTKGLPSKFFDEEHDTPNLPGSYGAAGWTANDKYLWLYDRYDIWQIDPTGREKPLNLTMGWGRQNKVRLRRADLEESEERFDNEPINAAESLYLTGIWESDKHTGILKATPAKNNERAISILTQSNHRYFGLSKAKNAPVVTYYKGNFQEPINLYQTDTTLASPVKLTKVNPQQDSIRWGSVELVNWMGTNGVKLEGLLYKPEGFDPKKKYPMLVYFYERNSETLNDYKAPSPSRSTINIAYCVSNGYLVFVPDIVYTTGQPGPNAYDCIVPGVLSLIDKGFVNRDRIGIQGQSWGGYQTAYLITRTNLFRAAGAGAPVANMTSAYGGIRWGTGMSRMFQYEKTQSRIGGTLWDKPLNYIENSPLFFANRVETPLFMTHNDADGAVPWYQGIEFFSALRRLNKPVWLLVYNGEDHNLVQRHNAKDLSVRMYQFFDYYLKDAPMPRWMSEGRTAAEKDRGDMKY